MTKKLGLKPKVNDQEFIQIWDSSTSVREVAERARVSVRAANRRRRSLENKYSISLPSIGGEQYIQYPAAITPSYFDDTHVRVVYSDCHFWPGYFSDAFWILLQVIQHLKPHNVTCNGDAFDGYSISRHSRIGWDEGPTVAEELDACDTAQRLIREAAGNAELEWIWGNHDIRFDTYFPTNAPNVEGVKGTRLVDHFPDWKFRWGVAINDSIVLKHRFRGGHYAARNNALAAGQSMVTGHTHRLTVHPLSDYNGTRYGIESGTLAGRDSPAFLYAEGSPTDWQSGFIVLTIDGSKITAERVEVIDGEANWRGKIWKA